MEKKRREKMNFQFDNVQMTFRFSSMIGIRYKCRKEGKRGRIKKGEVKKNRKCHARIDVNVRDGIKRTDKNGLYVCIDVCAKDEMRDLKVS